jgi:signal transduction histidine kinase
VQCTERGHLILERLETPGTKEQSGGLETYWQTIALPQGPGFAFAFAEDWEELWPGRKEAATEALLPKVDWLVLLFRPTGALEFWDERWERLTGLTRQEVAGTSGNLLLDWLFPQERDRNFVADLLNQPVRRGAQTVLELAGRERRRALMCTFLPVTGVASEQVLSSVTPPEDSWLMLACEPPSTAVEQSGVGRFLRQFTRGLSHLLNNYLTVPVGLAEMALERTDIPAELVSWFSQILESCMRAGRLIASLQDLALVTPGTLQQLKLADVMRSVLEELASETPTSSYELTLDVQSSDALVDANLRLLKIVLRHLLTNAIHALVDPQHRRIAVRIFTDATSVYCEVQDTGEGLATVDWTAVLAPFYSTKGPFAKEAGHAAHDATGLGLTVSQHLLALHGGRLELRSSPGGGTIARLSLPRAQGVTVATTEVSVPPARESAVSKER